MSSLENLVIAKYIASYKAAPIHFLNSITRAIIKHEIQERDKFWERTFERVVVGVGEGGQRFDSSIPPEMIRLAHHLLKGKS